MTRFRESDFTIKVYEPIESSLRRQQQTDGFMRVWHAEHIVNTIMDRRQVCWLYSYAAAPLHRQHTEGIECTLMDQRMSSIIQCSVKDDTV